MSVSYLAMTVLANVGFNVINWMSLIFNIEAGVMCFLHKVLETGWTKVYRQTSIYIDNTAGVVMIKHTLVNLERNKTN